MRAFEFITTLLELRRVPKGALNTANQEYKGWNLVYDQTPFKDNKVLRGKAELAKGQTRLRFPENPSEFVQGNTVQDVLDQLTAHIDSYRGSRQIAPAQGGDDGDVGGDQEVDQHDPNGIKTVTIFFNSLLAREIIGHGDDIWADLINHNGTPLLLLSTEDPGGFHLAKDRRSNANKDNAGNGIGLQAFVMSAADAKKAGLALARYGFGKPVQYMDDIIALPLEFRTEVYPGEVLRLNEPGLTVSPPNKGKQMAEGTATWELEEHGKASRALCKSSRSNDDLGASQLASCKSQGLRGRETSKKHTIGNKRQSIKGKHVKGHKYGGPLPWNKSDN
jgi:hypothetical protein